MNERNAAILEDLSLLDVSNGVVGFVFAATVPVALILAALSKGGMASESQLASWLFGGFAINGLLTIAFSLYFRQPLVFLWSIPGTVLVGQALTHLSWAEVVAAYFVTGALVLALGVSGLVNAAMSAVPMPIVMAMVAGVFLQFGIDWIEAFRTNFFVALVMTAVFVGLTAVPALARTFPPVIAALIAGVLVIFFTEGITLGDPTPAITVPQLTFPQFSWPAMIELVVPLAITVLVVHNGQGIAILKAAGHKPPVTKIAAACGIGSMITSAVGTVSTCLGSNVIAIIVTGDRTERHYIGALVVGLLGIVFGLLAPMIARLALAAPRALIGALAGLAMLRILQQVFTAAFTGLYRQSALITFLITVSGVTIMNIGAPFWGVVFGSVFAWLIERKAVFGVRAPDARDHS
jgi:benzoate membrane transport protein